MANADSILPVVRKDPQDGWHTLVNWTYKLGVPGAIEQPETTNVDVIYRDGTEGRLLAKNVAWSQVYKFKIVSPEKPEAQNDSTANDEGEVIPLAQTRDKDYLDGVRVHIAKAEPLIDILRASNAFRAIREIEFDLPDPHREPTIAEQFPHYFKDVSHLNTIDIYRVLGLWGVTDNAIAHAIKKLLVAGGRGAKDAEQDVAEAIVSLRRWQEMQAENAADGSTEG